MKSSHTGIQKVENYSLGSRIESFRFEDEDYDEEGIQCFNFKIDTPESFFTTKVSTFIFVEGS